MDHVLERAAVDEVHGRVQPQDLAQDEDGALPGRQHLQRGNVEAAREVLRQLGGKVRSLRNERGLTQQAEADSAACSRGAEARS